MKVSAAVATMLLCCVWAVAAVPATFSVSDQGWVVSDQQGPEDTGRTVDGLSAMLLVDTPGLLKKWSGPVNSFEHASKTSAAREQQLVAAVLFANPGINIDGTSDITGDFRVLAPDGAIYGAQEGARIWEGDHPAQNMLELGLQVMGIRIEPGDPSGTYTVECVVHDNLKKVSIRLARRFTVE